MLILNRLNVIRLLSGSLICATFPVCAGAAPLDFFTGSHGPAAQPSVILGWVFTAVALAVCLIIAVLLLGAIFHKRPKEDADKIGRGDPGLNWALTGTGVSTVVLFVMAIYALVVLNQTATPPTEPALTITVTGYDWWWKVVYENTDPAKRFETANEIHIPVGVPVIVKLKSADVIHAFWVPQLAGKTEMIPGLTNQQWLQADAPGIYHGQCTQFCGVQHAHMAFDVVAQTQEDFAAWEAIQRNPANPETSAGEKIFEKQCSGCHSLRGNPAIGGHGPDLTHLNSRKMIAAGLLPNTPQNVMDWIEHAQELKPGTRMPDIKLNQQDKAALSAYLDQLK